MEDESHPCIRLEKKDLYMFLARHLEESPECHAPSDQFNKTGIVICESGKVHKIVAMSFSKPGLHAVQQIIRCLPSSLRDCTVYLSRKPCTTCTTFLIQGSVSSIYYWPMAPEKTGDDSVVKEDIEQADRLLLRSHISSSVLLPMTSFETVKKIAKKIRCQGQLNSSFKLFDDQTEDFKKYCSLFNIDSCKDLCVKRMENAFHCYKFLLECFQLEKKEREETVHQHALQLCYFLAARSDDPDRGVGCTLYSQDGYFFGAGYNGYPIGILYANLPSIGRRNRRNGLAKRGVVLHAETNVLLYRSKSKIEESDVLYCTKPPCHDCQNLLKDVKIKTIHCVKESSKQSEENNLDDLKKNFDYHEWKQCNTQHTAGPPIPYLKKEELCIFLALHMENSPSESQNHDCKTGIVICEASKPKRIIALGCSTKELHAVPKVLLRFPNALKGCEVYMSRMPCNYCAKLLVQAQVSQVYYWPNFESEMAEDKQRDVLAKHASTIFTESYIVAAVYVPTIDNQRKMQILNSNRRASDDDDLIPVASVFDGNVDGNVLKCFNLEHLKDEKLKKYKENLTTAKECFKILASCKDEKIIISEEKSPVNNNPKYTHALQLCDLLASRSDNNNGVGTVIYKEDDIVALGYSGYPKGALNSLFYEKKDDDFDKHAIVCAEANAIIMSSEGDLRNAELITTREPCCGCLKLIQAKNIAKVIWPLQDRNQSRGLTEDPSEGQSAATAGGEPV
ncbi:cytidine and dCMP deaminase domain-containing protein 1-like isoform X2 [Rissa tridactyla]|uniref:cytidine and dCMP deaminase domain-containing protein 1-like isoform X2 n=1 Tax=Rissa tridactyla TaxID=75485 RepID=UPI0023BA8B56|nr:cytidine and dCMP deaminase domain-containing protein 1-like isoform X2 [Rissa tridactyla]